MEAISPLQGTGGGGGGVIPSESDDATVEVAQTSPLTLGSSPSLTVYNLNLAADLELALGDGHILTAANRVFFKGTGCDFLLSSGTLRTTGDRMFLGDGVADQGNVLTVAGKGTCLSVANYFSLSPNAGSNRILVRDGAAFEGAVYVGVNTAKAGGNEILVTGEGSVYRLATADSFRLVQGSDNRLVVSNSATASFAGSEKWASLRIGMYNSVGGGGAGDRNRVIVNGALLTADHGIWIGENSSSNVLEIANGGRVVANGDIQLGRSRDENDRTHPEPLSGNRLVVRGQGNWLSSKGGVRVGFGSGSQANAVEIPSDAELVYCGPLAVGCDAANVGNCVSVAGRLAVTNATTANWDVGVASGANVFSVTGAAACASFERTAIRVGGASAVAGNVLRVGGGARLSLTNASVAANGCLADFKDVNVTFAGDSGLTVGGTGGVIRMARTRLSGTGTMKVVVDGGVLATDRGIGGRIELVGGTVFEGTRFILGDYSRDTSLVISNATLRCQDFQPNYKDLADSNCQIHFYGDNPHLAATNLNFYGDATYNFHIPREGYALTNPDQAVVVGENVTRRDNAKKTGAPLIRVTGAEGPRKRGHWTLMRVGNAKWNFTNPEAGNGITADDVECGPGIRAVVTEKTIEVYVRSQKGCVLVVR